MDTRFLALDLKLNLFTEVCVPLLQIEPGFKHDAVTVKLPIIQSCLSNHNEYRML